MTFSVLHACDHRAKASDGTYYTSLAKNTWLTKRISITGEKIDGTHPTKFKLGNFYNPASLVEALPILEELGNNPKALVIRHKYIDYKKGKIVHRKSELVKNEASKLICIDIDSLFLPLGMSSTDLKAQGEYVCLLLHKCEPNFFPDDMGFIAQGSSSAGLSDNIKLHLWLENYDFVNQSQLRNLFTRINNTYKEKFKTDIKLVDTALYHSVQAHYLAYPVFSEGFFDPLKGKRTVYSYGNHSHVPQDYPSYTQPVHTTAAERSIYLDNIKGGYTKSFTLKKALEVVREWDILESGLRQKVIAAYHAAIQGQYCLEKLDEEIKPLIDRLRPGEYQNYINQGRSSAVATIKANSVRELPEECLGLPLTAICGGTQEKFLDIREKLPKDGVIFLKASLGTGKTHFIEQGLKDLRIKGKFLALTDTSALVTSNAARFGAGDFRQTKNRLDFASGEIERLSGTIHSLHKLKDFTNSFDFLFIDEADSLMNTILNANIIKDGMRPIILQVLSELLQKTKQVVISDGDISEETVVQYINLMEGSRELFRVTHIRQNLNGVAAFKHLKESSILGALQAEIDIGNKCLLVSDSTPETLNEYVTMFNRIFPQKVIKAVHAKSTGDDDIKEIVDETTIALKKQKVDALLCSPSITNGVDFNYFDTVFVITNSEMHTPNMRFQALMRERQPKSIHYFFKKIKPCNTGYESVTIDGGFLLSATKAYAARKEREYRSYVATFNYYLVMSGATVEVEDDLYDDPRESIDKQNYHTERVLAVLSSTSNKLIPRHNDAYEVKQMIKHYYNVDVLTEELTDQFLTEQPNKKAEYFHKVYPIMGDAILSGSVYRVKEALGTSGHLFYKATGESLSHTWDRVGLDRPTKILRRCGIKKNGDSTNLIKWYKKYCEYTDGVELPEKFRTLENAVELV